MRLGYWKASGVSSKVPLRCAAINKASVDIVNRQNIVLKRKVFVIYRNFISFTDRAYIMTKSFDLKLIDYTPYDNQIYGFKSCIPHLVRMQSI